MSTSVTTTGMRVGDTEATRTQSNADANAASEGQQARTPGAAGSGITAGIGAAQNSQVRPITVTPVDSKTLGGSYPGDHRSNPGDVAKASVMQAADNGGPRNSAGQFKGSKYETQPAFISNDSDSDSDAGN